MGREYWKRARKKRKTRRLGLRDVIIEDWTVAYDKVLQ